MTRGEYDVNNDNRVESADYQEHQLKQRKNGDVLHDDTNKVESIDIDTMPSKEKPYVGYGFKEVITAKKFVSSFVCTYPSSLSDNDICTELNFFLKVPWQDWMTV